MEKKGGAYKPVKILKKVKRKMTTNAKTLSKMRNRIKPGRVK